MPREILTVYQVTDTLLLNFQLPVTWFAPDPESEGANCNRAGYELTFSNPESRGLLLKLKFWGPSEEPNKSFGVLIDKVEP